MGVCSRPRDFIVIAVGIPHSFVVLFEFCSRNDYVVVLGFVDKHDFVLATSFLEGFPAETLQHICHAAVVTVVSCDKSCSSSLYVFYFLFVGFVARIPDAGAIFCDRPYIGSIAFVLNMSRA